MTASVSAAPRVAFASAVRLGGWLGPLLTSALVVLAGAAGDLVRYRLARWRASLGWLLVGWVGVLVGSARGVGLVVAVSCLPLLLAGIARRVAPVQFEAVAAPVRRAGWRHWVRRRWPMLARECGLSVQRQKRERAISWESKKAKTGGLRITQASDTTEWVAPVLRRVTTAGETVTLTVRTRAGQYADQIEAAGPALAATCGAVSHRVRVLTPFEVQLELVMREALASLRVASGAPVVDASNVAALVALTDAVPLGRRQDGTPWLLRLRNRHTLVVGCSGSGKGSVLWGVCGSLAPAVAADVVRLWGVDLKRGIEVGMGAGLFTATAYTKADALAVLRRLLAVIAERGDAMAGVKRLHEPRPGDPLHVLVIDELAALTAYGDKAERDEANRLLAEITTQGRAVGVVVLAFVQDPRKDTVPTRSLFTQTVALRLRSASEVAMVVGDGMATLAPAHRIAPSGPGTGYVLDEDGTVDRVRADLWLDDLVRHVAASHPSRVRENVTVPDDAPRSPRAPRKPRAPRTPRAPGTDTTGAGS